MYKHGFSFKSFYIFQIILVFLTLTSCKNFLNAGKVSEEIKDSIAYNNAKTVNIVISCKEDMGTIYPQQSYNAKLGYDFEIQFIINSDNYVIKNPDAVFEAVSKYDNTVSRADCVEFTPVERTIEDIKLGLYKTKARITKDNNDIMIRPVCTTLPSVVDIYPPFVPSGYAQDTTVKITFSKPMNPESFGNFECLIMTSDNGSVKDFYDKPYFSNDNCVLNIPTKKGENILNPDTSGTKQITININVNELKDTEGLTLSNSIIYTYCLNQTTDRKEPVIYSYELKTSENKILNSTDFNTWEQTPSIFSQNHLKDTVIFSIDGYDDESGLSGLRITETLFRLINGDASAHAISQYSEYEQITFTSESSGHKVYNVSDTYTLKTPNDGIIKLDFQVIDKSGNFSIPQTYYVIKDTTIDSNLITISGFNELEYHEATYDSDTFTLSLNDIPKDTYYENYSSDFLITVKWGYKEDEIKNIAEQDGLTFSFNYNPNLLTYIQIICSDELGNQRIITRVQPPRPNYNRKCITVASTSKTFTFTPYSYKSLQEIAAYNEAQLLVYFVERNVSAKPYKETVFKYDNKYVSVFRKGNSNGRYYYYPFYVLKYSDNSYWASPLSNYFMNIDGLEGYIKECIVSPVDSENTTTAIEDNNLLPEVLKIQAEPATNTGCYKIQLDKSQLDNNFTWNFNFTNTSTKEVESFNLDLFYLSTPAEYTLSVEARNSEGETYIKKSQLMQVNNEEASEKIILNKDTTPPVFNFIKEEKYFIDTSGVF